MVRTILGPELERVLRPAPETTVPVKRWVHHQGATLVGRASPDTTSLLPRRLDRVTRLTHRTAIDFFELWRLTELTLHLAGSPQAEAAERGKAFIEAGAPVVFVAGMLNEDMVSTLVEASGPRRLTVIGRPLAGCLEEIHLAASRPRR